MKLSSGLHLAAVGVCCAGTVASLAFVGCGSSSSGSAGASSSSGGSSSGGTASSSGGSSSGGGTSSSGSSGAGLTHPPASPSGASATTITTPHNYAIHKLYIGSDRTGMKSTTAWQSLGYDLDNLDTTASSTNVCTQVKGSSKQNQADGMGGIDNAFGSVIWALLTQLDSTAEATINSGINEGHFTVMTDVTGFDNTVGGMANATGLSGVILGGGSYAAENMDAGPAWSTATHWPLVPSLITGCTATGGCPAGTDPVANAKVKFPTAYQAGGVFVNGSPSAISLNIEVYGQMLTINVQSGIVTFQAAQGGVTNGTIAGVILTTDFVTELNSIAGSIDSSLCSGAALMTLDSSISEASDIVLSNGTVSNTAGTTCNAISIGLGFDATEIALPVTGDIEPGAQPAAGPCADGG